MKRTFLKNPPVLPGRAFTCLGSRIISFMTFCVIVWRFVLFLKHTIYKQRSGGSKVIPKIRIPNENIRSIVTYEFTLFLPEVGGHFLVILLKKEASK